MKYEKLVQQYVGEHWRKTSLVDLESGYGVACMLAFLSGVDSDAGAMADHLGVDFKDIQKPFGRLKRSRVFSERFDAKKDKALNGDAPRTEVLCAWGHIGGIASDIVYRSY